MKTKAHRLLASTCMSAALFCGLFPAIAEANPTGGVVAAGAATINSNGAKLDVHQATQKAVIDWRSFDIDAGEHTQFHQPNSTSIALNRVNSNKASEIQGKLSANGNVVVINQNGVLFGKNSQVDVNGIVATTADVDTDEFMNSNAPRFNKPGNPNASIINEGTITAKQAGLVGLVAPNVSNSGTITAKLGRVQLSSGDTATVDFYGDGLLEVAMSDHVTSQVVKNTGAIRAQGGTIALSAAKGKHIVDSLITVKGTLEARSAGSKQGAIVVAGNRKSEVHVTAKLDASGKGAGEKGGAVSITGDKIAVMAGSTIDVSGQRGGGEALIGGDYQGGQYLGTQLAEAYAKLSPAGQLNAARVFFEKGAAVYAQALIAGSGGRVVLWSDNGTAFRGDIDIRGGAMGGNGGFAEVSGKDWLSYAGHVDARAFNGGLTGSLLLDPADITISNAVDTDISGASPFDSTGAASSNLNVTTLVNALNSANVTITSAAGFGGVGNITFIDPVAWNSMFSLNVLASNNITVNNTITNAGTGNINLVATIAPTGDITINNAISTGGSISAQSNRNLTVASNLTTGTAGGLNLQAAGGSTAGTGNLSITGNLSVGSGGLTLLSGVNGTRPSWTMTGTNLIPNGGSFGSINISGFNALTLNRALTLAAGQNLTFANNTSTVLGNSITTSGGGTITIGNPASVAEAASVTLNSGGGAITLGTVSGTAGGVLETLTTNSGAGATSLGNLNNLNLAATAGTFTLGTMGQSTTMGSVNLNSVNGLNLSDITASSVTASTSSGSADINANGNITSAGAVSLASARNLTVAASRTVSAGGAGNLSLQAAGGSTAGTGTLNLIGNIGVGTGALTLISGSPGSRSSWTANATTLVHAGNFTGAIDIQGFNDLTLARAFTMNANSNLLFSNNTRLILANNLTTSGTGTITINDPLMVQEAASVAITTANQAITFGGAVYGSAGGATDTLTTNSGTAATTFNGSLNNLALTGTAGSFSFTGGLGTTNTMQAVSLTTPNSITLPDIIASSVTVNTTGAGSDITAGGNITTTGAIVMQAMRDITVNAARTLLAGTGIDLRSANGNVAGTGRLNLLGNLNVGTGALTLLSGINGTRADWLANTTTLAHAGNWSAAINIQGFNDFTLDRAFAMNANQSVQISNNTRLILGGNITTSGTGTISISNPMEIEEAGSFTISTVNQPLTFGSSINGTAGGAAESLTVTAGTGTITYGTVNGINLTTTASNFSFTAPLGGVTPLGTVNITSANALSLPAITATGNVTANTTAANTDLTATGNITSGGNITLTAMRNLTVNAARTLTTGATGALALSAANGVVTGAGALTINGNLSVGTGNLTLISGTARPNLTLNGTNLVQQGANFGVINISGFNDLTIDRDLTSSGNITVLSYRDLNLNATRTVTPGAAGTLSMRAAGGVVTGTGNFNLNGNLVPGTGNVTLLSGVNGTRPNWTMTTANFAPQSTLGTLDAQGFLNVTIDRPLTSTGNIVVLAYRDLIVNAGNAITTSTTGGLTLQAAGNVVTGTGNLTLNNNVLSVGTGALSLTSGVNGTRPSQTFNATNLVNLGATFGAVTITGFLDTVIDRSITSSGSISITSFRDLTLNATRTLTPGAASALTLQAANAVTTGTGSLFINGILAPGTGTTTIRNGINGTRQSNTLSSTWWQPQGGTVGAVDIQGFLDFIIDSSITSTGNITITSFRDLTLNATRVLTSGAAGGLTLGGANNVVTGTGRLILNGTLASGTGTLSLITGINGTRPNITLNSTLLTRLGANFGAITVSGFQDITVNRDMNSSGNVTMLAYRDLTLNAANSIITGAANALDLRAANSVVTGTGNLSLNGNISSGTGALTLMSGVNGTRPSITFDSTKLTRLGATFGAVTITGFLDTVIDRDINSSAGISITSFRDLMVNATRTLTTAAGATGVLTLQAANNVVAGTGRLDMLGIMSVGTGNLTLISGINGTRPDLTLTNTNLIRQGANFGNINMQGFNTLTIERDLNSSGTVTLSSNTQAAYGSDINGTVLTFGNPFVIAEGRSITVTGTTSVTFNNTVNGTAGGLGESLTVISGTGATTFTNIVGGVAPLENLTVNGDSLTISANVIGTGTLTLAPFTAGRAVNIGTGNADNVTTSFDLSNNELSRLVDGWGSIVVGSLTSGNTTNLRSAWSDPITFRSGVDFINSVATSTADTILVNAVRDVILNQDLITTNATANALIVSAGRNFINNRAGTALQVGAGGRWLIYSTNPTDTTGEQFLTQAFNRYSCTYAGSCPALGTGNGFLYSFTPMLDITIDPQTYRYGDAVLPATGYTLQTSGYLNAMDLAEGSVSGSGIFATTYVQGDNAGTSYTIINNGSTFLSNLGYGFNYVSPTGLTVGTRAITVRAANQNRIYGFGSLGTTGFVVSTGSLYGTDTISDVTLATNATTSTSGEYNYSATPWNIAVSNAVFSSGDINNYTITYADAPVGLTIARRALTLAAITASDKIYNGLTAATVTGSTFDDAVTGDVLSMTGLTGTFDTANVGTGKTVTVSGGTFGGADSNNYSFTLGSATGTADVTPRALTITANNKVMTYGAGNTFNGFTPTGLQNGETIGSVTYSTNATSSTSGNWNYAATPWTITASAATGGTFDINNYTVNYVDGTLTVNRRALAVTATGIDKTYDGLTTASVTFGDDRVLGDVLTATGSASYGDKTAANGKTITVTGIGISGTDANNYTANTSTTTTANIARRALTLATIAASNKIYDGLVGATITGSTFDNAVGGDVLSMSGLTGDFDTANVGNGKTVTLTGGTFGGADANNYTFTLGSATTTANITPRALTITANNKVMSYGAGNTYNGFTPTGLQNGETIGSVTYSTNATTSTSGHWNYAAAPWTITPSNATGGTFDINNYSVSYVNGSLNVNRRALAVTATGADKVYNGLTNASVTFGDDRVLGDVLTAIGTANFSDKNVATGKTITVTGIGISGVDANNYTANATTTASADITARALTITANTKTMTYGAGNTFNGFTPTGLQNGETIGSVTYSTNATTSTSGHWNYSATPWDIVASAATGGTFDINNYSVTYVDGALNVNRRALTIGATGIGKTYDGLTTASVTFSDNRIGGDVFTATGTAAYLDKTAANGKTINVTGISISGTDADNYTHNTTATTTANIARRALTLATITAADKVYNGLVGATITGSTFDNAVAGDTLTMTGLTGNFSNKNVANGKTVTVTGGTFGGADAANYSFTLGSATTTANITPRALTITANDKTMTYGNGNTFNGFSSSGLQNGETIGSVTYATNATSSSSGNWNAHVAPWAINASNAAGGTFDINNYSVTYVAGNLNIARRAITVGSIVAADKEYDGTTVAPIASYSFAGAVGGDALTLTGVTGQFDAPDVGIHSVVIATGMFGGADAANYNFTLGSAGSIAFILDPTNPMPAYIPSTVQYVSQLPPTFLPANDNNFRLVEYDEEDALYFLSPSNSCDSSDSAGEREACRAAVGA